jgi:hypothetical protein
MKQNYGGRKSNCSFVQGTPDLDYCSTPSRKIIAKTILFGILLRKFLKRKKIIILKSKEERIRKIDYADCPEKFKRIRKLTKALKEHFNPPL